MSAFWDNLQLEDKPVRPAETSIAAIVEPQIEVAKNSPHPDNLSTSTIAEVNACFDTLAASPSDQLRKYSPGHNDSTMPATIVDKEGRRRFIKVQGIFQMCGDLFRQCDTPKYGSAKNVVASSKWEEGELLFDSEPRLPEIVDPHPKFRANMVLDAKRK